MFDTNVQQSAQFGELKTALRDKAQLSIRASMYNASAVAGNTDSSLPNTGTCLVDGCSDCAQTNHLAGSDP